MKKNKKWLAIVLSVVMAFSTLTVAFSAFAATPEDVEKLNKDILSVETLTGEMINAVKNLSSTEKDLLSVEAYVKVYNQVFESSTGATETEKEAEVNEKLGGQSDAGNVAKNITNLIQSEGAEALELYNKASARSIELADHMSYGVVAEIGYVKVNKTNSLNATNAILAFGAENEKKVSLPTDKDYNLQGAVDAAQKAADQFAKYQVAETQADKVKAYNDAAIQNWVKACAVDGSIDALASSKLQTVTVKADKDYSLSALLSAINGSKATVTAMTDAIAFYDNMNKTFPMDAKDVVKGAENNEKLIALKAAFGALSSAAKKQAQADVTNYTKYETLLKTGVVVPGQYNHSDFEPEVIGEEVEGPLNDVLFNTLKAKLPDIGNMLMKALVNVLMPGNDGSMSLDQALTAQFNNKTITKVAKWWANTLTPILNSALEGMGMGSGLAEQLFGLVPSSSYGGLVMAFYPRGAYGGASNPLYAYDAAIAAALAAYTAWDQVPDDFNWYVKDGDYETFMQRFLDVTLGVLNGGTLSFILPGTQPFTNMFVGTKKGVTDDPKNKNPNSVFEADGSIDMASFQPGAWDTVIIPILQSLGVDDKDIMSTTDYAKYIYSLKDPGHGKNAIVFLGNYLKPLVDILYKHVMPKFQADPIGYLAEVLPGLMYHLTDGCIIDGLNNTLDWAIVDLSVAKIDLKDIILGLFTDANGGVKPTELSLDLIWNLISPLLSGLGVNISLEDITKIARMGTPTVVDTIQLTADKTVRIDGDKDSVLNYIFNALGGLISTLGIDFSVNGTFVKVEAPGYPHDGKMGKDVMNAMIDGLDGLLGGFININDLINNGLCTNVMAADAIQAIYSALSGVNLDLSVLGLGSLPIPPSVVAAAMSEDIYKDVAAALTVDGDSWDNVALVLRNGDTIFDNVKMGFNDGDREGFLNCIVAALRPVVKMLADTGFVTNTGSGEDTVYGLYETLIIPTFEAIGLTPAADSATFTSNYSKLLKKADKGPAYDYLVKTILAPVLDLLDDVAAAPAATLMKVLPNLAYAIQYNPQLAFIGNLLNENGGLTAILNGLIQGIATGEDANGNPVYGLANFELPALPLDALASAGTLADVKSKSALHETYQNVKADTADAFVTTFYYLYDAINHKDNMKTISGLLAGIEGLDPSIAGMIDTILNDVFTRGKEEALCMLGTILAADVWECPNGEGNNGGKTPGTGDYTVPAIAVLAVMFTAGAAIMVLRKKKVTE